MSPGPDGRSELHGHVLAALHAAVIPSLPSPCLPVFHWTDSISSHCCLALGPECAPRCSAIAHAAASVGNQNNCDLFHSVSVRVSLSACLCLCLSACLSACLSVCLSVCLSLCLSLCLSDSVSLSLSVCLSLCLSASVSVCLSASVSASLSLSLSFFFLSSLFFCFCLINNYMIFFLPGRF